LRPEVKLKLEPFLQTLSEAPQKVLLLDYDGTLAPFQARRDQAFPYLGIERLLQEIIRNGQTRVVVISGRDINDLLPLLDVHPRPEMWGVHGLQRLRTDGAAEVPRLHENTLHALSDAERWLTYQHLRHTAEFKGGAIAVHWRGLNDTQVKELRSRVLLGWRLIAEQSGLNLLEFDGGVEIRAPEANKGNAVRTFLREVGPDVPVAYLGDDNADESAFRAIGNRGITMLVRPEWRQTSASFWLKPPDEVLDFLGLWLRCCVGDDTFQGGAAKAVNG
jgi:trehalose 6-phosphate phosphatase